MVRKSSVGSAVAGLVLRKCNTAYFSQGSIWAGMKLGLYSRSERKVCVHMPRWYPAHDHTLSEVWTTHYPDSKEAEGPMADCFQK